MRMAMIAITTKSSIKVNPDLWRVFNRFISSDLQSDRHQGWITSRYGAAETALGLSLQLESRQRVRLRLDRGRQQRPVRVEVALLQPVGGAQPGAAALRLACTLLPLDQDGVLAG